MGNGTTKSQFSSNNLTKLSRRSTVHNRGKLLNVRSRSHYPNGINENSFTVRGIAGQHSMSLSSRLDNMHTHYERHSGGTALFASDKDRLENVLLCIFAEATLKSAFFDFLSERCMENLLTFRDEVEYLKSIDLQPANQKPQSPTNQIRRSFTQRSILLSYRHSKEIETMAAAIYHRYINRVSPKHIPIDYLTIQAINEQLRVTTSHQVTEKNPQILRKAFDEATSKVFHQLIYDHLAHFLMSDHYISANKPIKPVALDEDITEENREEIFDTMIAHPICCFFFKNYLRHLPDKNRRFPLIEQLECLHEMLDFCTSQDNGHRAQRCQLIIHRYGRMAYGVEELILMRNELMSAKSSIPEKFLYPDSGMFHLVYYRLSNALLAEHLDGFVTSRFYTQLEDFNSKQEVFLALNRFKDGTLCSKLIESSGIPEFHLESDAVYEMALKEPLGVSLFKRFATKHFMEENIDFYMEVKYFKEENYATPPAGSAIFCDEFTSIEEMRFMRAMKICEKYIEVGAHKQLNVSNQMRERILRTLSSSNRIISLDIFDDAVQEVKVLMKHNLWVKFCQTESYALFVRKCREKPKRLGEPRMSDVIPSSDPVSARYQETMNVPKSSFDPTKQPILRPKTPVEKIVKNALRRTETQHSEEENTSTPRFSSHSIRVV